MKRLRGKSEELFRRARQHQQGAARKLALASRYFEAALRALDAERTRERERAIDAINAAERREPNPAGVP